MKDEIKLDDKCRKCHLLIDTSDTLTLISLLFLLYFNPATFKPSSKIALTLSL